MEPVACGWRQGEQEGTQDLGRRGQGGQGARPWWKKAATVSAGMRAGSRCVRAFLKLGDFVSRPQEAGGLWAGRHWFFLKDSGLGAVAAYEQIQGKGAVVARGGSLSSMVGYSCLTPRDCPPSE